MRRLLFVGLAVLAVSQFALAEPVVLSGLVLGPDGAPAAGAKVTAMEIELPWQVKEVEAVTDAAGAFTLRLQMQRMLYPGWVPPILVTKQGLATEVAAGKPGEPITVRLGELPPPWTGVVKRADGTPIAGATVTVGSVTGASAVETSFSHSGAAILATDTDAEGRFSLEGLGTSILPNVTIAAEGLAPLSQQLRPPRQVGTLVLQQYGSISGRVLQGGPGGERPLAGVEVNAAGQSASARAVTGADGSFRLEKVAPARVQVTVQPPAGLATAVSQFVTPEPGQALEGVNIVLTPGGLVRGTVTLAGAGPLAGASVNVRALGGQVLYANARCDARGQYELRLPPGDYALTASYQGTEDGTSRPLFSEDRPTVTVTEGGTVEKQDLLLKPSRKIRGVVLLPDGNTARGVRVSLLSNFQEGAAGVVTDAAGRFELDAESNTRPMAVLAIGDDCAAALRLKESDKEVELHLQPAAWVTTHVQDDQGKPVAGIKVFAYTPFDDDSPQRLGQAVSGPDGAVRLGPLPPGQPLDLMADWSIAHLLTTPEWREPKRLLLQPGETRAAAPLEMNPGGRTLPVFVGDPEGRPVAGAAVFSERCEGTVQTDDKGRTELKRLPLEGAVTVVAVQKVPLRAAGTRVDPAVGPWPGLLLQPLGEATGVFATAQGPAGKVSFTCQPEEPQYDISYRIAEALGRTDDMGREPASDAAGRWRVTGLVAGLKYHVIVWTEHTAHGRRGVGALEFVATGGPQVQDLGTVTYRQVDGD